MIQQFLIFNIIRNNFNFFDWSDVKELRLPIPTVCAIINIICDSLPTGKFDDKEAWIEYWDKQGNYFKKKKITGFAWQGDSSVIWPIKIINLILPILK